jgi:hypothetical protein
MPIPEAGADQTADVGGDTGHDAVAEAGDAGPRGDAADAADAAVDANDAADSRAEAADAFAAADTGDGPNAFQQYADANAQAFCKGQAKCCAGDGGGFNVAACAQAYYAGGWRSWLPANPSAYTAGHLTLNASQAGTCLSSLQNFPCGTTTTAEFAALLNACNGVLSGNIATGSGGCISSFECANGYCNMAMDGGGGTGICTVLVGDGGACTAGPDSPDQMCAQAGNQAGSGRLWCNLTFTDGGGTCQPPLADTASCFNMTTSSWDDYGCASLLCGDNGCGGTTTAYPDPVFCSSYIDGSGGG